MMKNKPKTIREIKDKYFETLTHTVNRQEINLHQIVEDILIVLAEKEKQVNNFKTRGYKKSLDYN